MFEESALNYISSKALEEQRQKWNLLRNCPETTSWDDWRTSLAGNQTISNQALVNLAIEQEANATESSRWLEASILQLRMNSALLAQTHELFAHCDQDARVIGAMIATDINQCSQIDASAKQQCFETLIEAYEEEPNVYAKTWLIVAITSFKTSLSVDFMLRQTDSEQDVIRMTIADVLLSNRPQLDHMNQETTLAVLKLAADPSPTVAWNILWEIAEYPHLFRHAQQSIVEVAKEQIHSSDEQLSEIATRVVEVLS